MNNNNNYYYYNNLEYLEEKITTIMVAAIHSSHYGKYTASFFYHSMRFFAT